MRLKTINIKNFRNYCSQTLELCSGVNIISGLNAQGKTNFIEAISIISTGRSHRTRKEAELIRWDEDIAEIKAEICEEESCENDDFTFLDYRFNRDKKKFISVNGVKKEKLSELLGHLYTVIFSPDHMSIVKGGPAERRRFMDVALSQLKPSYYHSLSSYSKVLDQRNMTLQKNRESINLSNLLDVWDKQLVKYGIKIIEEREIFIKLIKDSASIVCDEVSGKNDKLNVKYVSSIFENSQKHGTMGIGEAFEKKLFENRNMDIKKGHTSVGPHRDDFSLLVNGREVRNFGSQGQQRTVLLALKIAELKIMKEEAGHSPVLLLDDVFSELDSERKEYLLRYLKGMQSIITCTDADVIRGLKDVEVIKYFKVERGNICSYI